jgi:hypothetical protein
VKVLAIKENVKLCPWADVVYGCDGPWWRANNGLPGFTGLKLAHDSGVCARYRDLHKIEIEDANAILVERPGTVGNGGNSGFQALNIAVQLGTMRILLIGFDMHGGAGLHWYGANSWRQASNPRETNFVKWRGHLAEAAPRLARLGVHVVTAPPSALTCFEQMSIEDALAAWRL